MNWHALFEPHTSARICLTLLHSLWQVSLAALLATAASRLWRNKSVERDYLVHVAALVIAVLAVPVTFMLLPGGEHGAPVMIATSAISGDLATATNTPGNGISPAVQDAIEQPQLHSTKTPAILLPIAEPQSAVGDPLPWQTLAQWAAALYAAGAAFMLLRLGFGVAYTERLRRDSRPLRTGPAANALRNLAAHWRLSAVPVLAEAERVAVPMIVGLLKPMILVPTSAVAGLAPNELELILAHELAHIRRHDLWVNLLQRLCEVALFFNPALWYLSRRIAALREYCCDDYVCQQQSARAADTRTNYAAALLRVVELAKPAAAHDGQLAALAVAGRTPSELRRRVARLFGEPVAEPLRVSRGGLLAVTALGLSILVGPGLLRSSAETANDKRRAATDNSAADEAAANQAAVEKTASSRSQFPPPETEADRIVAAARARTFGLEKVPRISFRISYWNSDVTSMKKLSERSLEMLWKAPDQDVDETMRRNTTSTTTLAWDVPKLLIQTDRLHEQTDAATPPALYTQSYYWDGSEGWIGESNPKAHNVYRYDKFDKLFDGHAGIFGIYLPQCAAAGSRIPWGGPEALVDEYAVDVKLTRYKPAGTEKVAGVECDIYDGPARHERIWIEKSTGLIKAVAEFLVHEDVPNYWTNLIREVAGRTFKDGKEYGTWREEGQPAELKARLGAHWAAAHWGVAKPGNLTVFSDYREVAPGVRWPMLSERSIVLYNGRDESQGYRYIRGEAAVTGFVDDFVIADLAKAALPQVGDPVADRRYDPEINYKWEESLKKADLDAAGQKKLDERRQAEDKKRAINATPINSVADAMHILTDGPKVDPADIWIRAIKYLVEHKDESLPIVIKQLDTETRDHPISKLAFALRAIGDKRGVPALIRAIPKTLLPSRSDFGVEVEDPELVQFAQQHDQNGKVRKYGGYVDYGRAFREVTSALHRLTGKDFGEMELNWVHLSESPAQRAQQQDQFHEFAKRWADWWDAEGKSTVDDPAYAKVNLPPFAPAAVKFAGRDKPPAGAGVKLLNGAGNWIVQATQEAKRRCFIDLDTAREGDWPKSLPPIDKAGFDSPELLAWARQKGFDVLCVTHTPAGETEPLYCLVPLEMHAWRITPAEHRALPEAMAGGKPYPLSRPVKLLVPQRQVKLPYDYEYGGDAFLFVTREGTAGVLRMTSQVTDTDSGGGAYSKDEMFSPTGVYRGAKISFKPMSEVEAAAKGGSGAALNPKQPPTQIETTHTLKVIVVDGEERPLPGAKVFQNHVCASDELAPNGKKEHQIKNQEYLTNESGQADVSWTGDSVDLRLWVSKAGYVPLHAMWSTDLQSDGDQIPASFRFTLRPGTTIGGVVQDEAGKPVAGAKIEVANVTATAFNAATSPPKPGVRPVPCMWLDERDSEIVTDENGRWTAENVPEDAELKFQAPGLTPRFPTNYAEFPLRVRVTHPDYAAYNGLKASDFQLPPTLADLRSRKAMIVLKRHDESTRQDSSSETAF